MQSWKSAEATLRGHRLLQVLVDLLKKASGGEPLLVGVHEQGQILGHEARLDRVDGDLLQRRGKLGELRIAVELGAVSEAACPGVDRRDRVGGSLASLLVFTI